MDTINLVLKLIIYLKHLEIYDVMVFPNKTSFLKKECLGQLKFEKWCSESCNLNRMVKDEFTFESYRDESEYISC